MLEASDLLIGTYQRLGGQGLLAGQLVDDQLVIDASNEPITNTSFGVWSASDRLYIVAEQQDGRVRSVARRKRAITIQSEASSGGEAPCHLALDPTASLLAVANYESGSVALFLLNGDKLPPHPVAFHQLTGSGPHLERQAGSHAHWVGFADAGRRLYCVDLGGDAILMFNIDRVHPSLDRPTIAYRAAPGSGPRHLAFHPTLPLAFLVSELASTLTLLAILPDGSFQPQQILSTLPYGASQSLGGTIVLNSAGDRIYVTNRGHDSLATFAFDGTAMELLDHVPSGGASPRFLLPLEDRQRMLVANEEGGTVAVFAIEADGRLRLHGAPANIRGAVFLAVAPG